MDLKSCEKEEVAWLNKDHSLNLQDYAQADDGLVVETNYNKTPDEGSAWPQIVASLVMASFHLVVGFSLAFSAIIIPQLEHESSDIPVTKTETSWIGLYTKVALSVI